ncbi:Vesicle-associated membrane protein/synaptobrevin-binding protein [Phytophthora cinnamomi]|uniref:Vesicle-associated membrane protein/synaptobrevin-binding protein n=1 Tax=Phytophthora cinnamomi TaxID=4785 RepID=UPI003559CF6B|nr:Vesicle-associated membrane protein/synaptobrevin-binding protein [Phytophthora cinnamomi]KAG6619279.1 Vesicle-associated membrane protein/synaptobrevin-binding protein [Phytophthora cinnamomi]
MASSGVDVALAPNSSVILEPADSLAFHLQPQTAPQAVLTIRNVADDRQIAFKVKTTRPLRYLVRPNQGLLGPNGSASIMVILQQKDCDELLRLDPAERQLANDKFLVQSIYVDDSFYELVKTKSTKEMADELTNMWARTDKRALSNKKLRCRFVQDGEEAAGRPASPPSPQRVASTNASPAKTAAASDARFQTRLSDEVREEVATPAQLSSALLQDDKPQAPKVAENREGNKETVQEVAALRKKYDELVAFTVQLTAQRDVLMSDLDKTRQLLQKASTDAQRVKKLSEETSTLRHRKNAGGNGASSNEDSQAITGKGPKEQGAFGPMHLLICAIIFFLVGRYY